MRELLVTCLPCPCLPQARRGGQQVTSSSPETEALRSTSNIPWIFISVGNSFFMKIVLFFIAAIVFLICQITFSEFFSIKEIKPDFILLLLVYVALTEKRTTATLAGFVLGLVKDFYGTGVYGLSAMTNSIATFIAGSFKGRREFRSFYEPTIVIFAASLTKNILAYSILSIGSPLTLWRAIVENALPSTLYTIVFGLIICALMPRPLWQNIRKFSIKE